MRSEIRQDIGFDGGVSGEGVEIAILVEYARTDTHGYGHQ